MNETIKLREELLNQYTRLEEKYKPKGIDVGTYDTPVNFNESLTMPIHRWYGYKEGFSPSFVNDFISAYTKSKDSIVFDPFGGVGTTGLEAIKMGYNSYLMDVNPLGIFASKVKTSRYNLSEIDAIKVQLSNLKTIDSYNINVSINNDTVKKYFDEITWDSLLQIKSFILNINEEKTRDLFSLALLSLIEEISTHHKNGNGVKKKRVLPEKNDFFKLRNKVIDKVNLYIDDLVSTTIHGECTIFNQSNLDDYILPQKADIVLTSPPYANCFDYSKVYLTELWVGGFFSRKEDQKTFRENSVISHVHYRWSPRNEEYGARLINDIVIPILSTETLWSNNIIPMLKGYFSDMGKFLRNLSTNLNNDATVGIVVGNSVYGGTPIATDIILAKQAEEIGFECMKIKIYRKVIASSQQMIRLNEFEKHFVRESLIILKWRGI